MKIRSIVNSSYFVMCCLLLIILWGFIYHHHAPNMSITSGTQSSQVGYESFGLLSLLRRVATESRTVIITMVDQEWSKPESLLNLFLESFRIGEGTKHLLNHLIVVALDDEALKNCLRAHPHCYLHKDSRRKYEFLNPDGLVASWWKKAFIKEVLELGYNIMFTEADVMWLRNPLMHCHPHHSVSVACGFSSRRDQQKQYASFRNTGGFFYAKSDDATVDLFKILNVERVVHPETANQSLCDIVKRKDVIHGLEMKVTYLDDVNFGRFCHSHPEDQSNITTLHAGCCNETKSKVHYLKLLLQDRKNKNMRLRIPNQCT